MEKILYFYLVMSLCFTVFESIDRVIRYWGFLRTSFKVTSVHWLIKSFVRDLISNPFIMPVLLFNYVSNKVKDNNN